MLFTLAQGYPGMGTAPLVLGGPFVGLICGILAMIYRPTEKGAKLGLLFGLLSIAIGVCLFVFLAYRLGRQISPVANVLAASSAVPGIIAFLLPKRREAVKRGFDVLPPK